MVSGRGCGVLACLGGSRRLLLAFNRSPWAFSGDGPLGLQELVVLEDNLLSLWAGQVTS